MTVSERAEKTVSANPPFSSHVKAASTLVRMLNNFVLFMAIEIKDESMGVVNTVNKSGSCFF